MTNLLPFARIREGHRQSDEHWNRLKGNVGKTSERRGGAHVGFSEHVDTILNRTERTELSYCHLSIIVITKPTTTATNLSIN